MQKAEVKAFKYELRNYNFYLQSIKDTDEKIEYFYDRLGGVRGVDPSKEPLHTVKNIDYEYLLREKILHLEQNKALLERKVNYIDQILGNIKTSLRNALKSVYVDGERIDKVSAKYYVSPNGLAYRLNKAIEEALR